MANYTKLKVIWKNNLNNIYKDNTIIGVGQEAVINFNEDNISSICVNFKVNGESYKDLVGIRGNLINVPFKSNVLKAGTHQLEIVAYLKNGDVVPSPTFSFYVEESLESSDNITAETQYPLLVELLEKVGEWNEEAVANETHRKSTEIQRINEETERLKKEVKRQNDEIKRIENEDNRIENENNRIENEERRKSNELERQVNESIREGKLNNIETEVEELKQIINELEREEYIKQLLNIDYDKYLSFNTNETIIGYVDNDNNIILLTDELSKGIYQLKYEYEDGTEEDIKSFIIHDLGTNLLDVGDVYLNQRYSQSGGGLVTDSISTGMFALIIPLEGGDNITYTLKFENLKRILTASLDNTMFLLDENKSNPINVNGHNCFSKMTSGVIENNDGTATVTFSAVPNKKYVVVNIEVQDTTISNADIADYIIRFISI